MFVLAKIRFWWSSYSSWEQMERIQHEISLKPTPTPVSSSIFFVFIVEASFIFHFSQPSLAFFPMHSYAMLLFSMNMIYYWIKCVDILYSNRNRVEPKWKSMVQHTHNAYLLFINCHHRNHIIFIHEHCRLLISYSRTILYLHTIFFFILLCSFSFSYYSHSVRYVSSWWWRQKKRTKCRAYMKIEQWKALVD